MRQDQQNIKCAPSESRRALESTDLRTPPTSTNMWDYPDAPKMYHRFAQAEWYQSVLEHLIEMLPLQRTDRILDVGSGTGSGSVLLAQRIERPGFVFGIDNSPTQVEYATMCAPPSLPVSFLAADALCMGETVHETVDAIVAFNSIHLVGDLKAFLTSAAAQLNSEGYLGFCTGYATGAMETAEMITVAKALEAVSRRLEWNVCDSESRRRTGVASAATTLRVRTLHDTLNGAGFNDIQIQWQKVMLPVESIAGFLTLPGFNLFQGAMPADQLKQLLIEELHRNEVISLERKWLHVTARKI